jgi:predicted PurR-regulated permease PerM
MAESTALEALTAELLGDVGLLYDQVKSLRESLPNIAQEITETLKNRESTISSSSDKLLSVFSGLEKQTQEFLESATRNALETAKLDFQQSITIVATDVVRNAVGKEIGQMVNNVTEVSNKLVDHAKHTEENIRASSRQVIWTWANTISAMLVSGIVSAILVLVVFYAFGLIGQKTSNLSSEELTALHDGMAIDKAWSYLSKKEQNNINDLANKAH